jgi:hypothetical protein
MTVHCKVCRHQWELLVKIPIPLDRFILAVKGWTAAGCPACGAYGDQVLCGPAPTTPRTTHARDPQVQPSGTPSPRA